MVVRLDERAAVRGNPLVIVLVAGLDDLAGIGIPELLLVERVERRGMSRSIDGSLLLLVGCHCPVEAIRLSILEGLPRRQSLHAGQRAADIGAFENGVDAIGAE